MADATLREVTSTRVEIRLQGPTNWVEVQKAITWAQRRLSAVAMYDDTVTVETDGDDIVLWWLKGDEGRG